MLLLLSSCGASAGANPSSAPAAQGPVSWIQMANGKLVYGHDEQGNQIPDFSAVGYGGGGVPLPDVPVRVTLNPHNPRDEKGLDDTPRIQQALDQVAKLPADAHGVRGAVMLTAGVYSIQGTINMNASGVVLRGAGSGAATGSTGTVLAANGKPHTLIKMGGSGTWQQDGPAHHITDAYVPVGARTFKVDNAEGLAVGDHVIVQRPTTAAWIHVLGMDSIPPRKDGHPISQWKPDNGIFFDRTITAIDGTRITIDVPLTNALEHQYTDATVWKYTFPGRISQVGIENLSSDAAGFVSSPGYDTGGYFSSEFVIVGALENGWINNVIIQRYGNGMTIGGTAKWVTIDNSQSLDVGVPARADAPAAFTIAGQQSLVEHCKVTGSPIHSWVTQAATAGPNVFYQCSATGPAIDAQGHQRWGNGTLFDNMSIPDGHFALQNRTNLGSGQGWSAANDVLWNCVSKTYLVENPPTAHNWAFGCQGKNQASKVSQGVIVSPGQQVQPDSLYVEQLRERVANPALNP